MPSDRPALRLQDIIDNADDIATWIAGTDETAFRKDRKTIRSVERSIEIVIEAAGKLDPDTKAQIGDYPWDKIRSMGNRLRHGYDEVSLAEIWNTAVNDIPRLAEDCRRVLKAST